MPEAPEIFYLKELLKQHIMNKTFEKIISNTKSTVKLPSKSKVVDVDCKGKLLWIQTENYYVHLHMMISGWLVFERPKICKYEFVFSNMTIYMDDTRRFSKVKIINTHEKHYKEINKLGFSFLKNEITKEKFIEIILSSNKNISALLLNQKIFCGVGNYIRNEALYMVKIHPSKKANDISKKDAKKLYDKIRYIIFSNLYEMLQNNNSKIKIPVYIKNIAPDNLQIPYKFRVYGREKDNYGNIITREKIAGRWAYYVKNIQKI
jgi:formamidopyrimidine-DNA glycosylase